jgi:hypothetical protein
MIKASAGGKMKPVKKSTKELTVLKPEPSVEKDIYKIFIKKAYIFHVDERAKK